MMKKNHGVLPFICAAALFAVFVSEARAEMSLNEFLEYSVGDLQERVRALNSTNQEMRQRCDALRRRILLLRQEMRTLDNQN